MKIDFVSFAVLAGSGIGYGPLWLFHVTALVHSIAALANLQNWQGMKKALRLNATKILLLFLCLYSASTIWSMDAGLAMKYIFYLLNGVWVYFYVADRPKLISSSLQAFEFAVFLALAVSILEILTPFRLPTSPYSPYADLFMRDRMDPEFASAVESVPTAFFGNPNNLAAFLILYLPFALFKKRKRRVKSYIEIVSIFTVVIYTESRGALIAGCLSLFAYIFISGLMKKASGLLVVLSLALAFIGSSVLFVEFQQDLLDRAAIYRDSVARYVSFGEVESDSIGIRKTLILNGIESVLDTKGLGVGAGNSLIVQQQAGNVPRGVSSMHNFWVEVLVDSGIVGLALLLAFLISLASRVRRKSQFCIDSEQYGRAILIALFVLPVTVLTLSSAVYFLPMWFIFGLAAAYINRAPKTN